MKKKLLIICLIVIIIAVAAFFMFGSGLKVPQIPGINYSPASKVCIDDGGTLQTKKRGDGATYDICFFEDNRQCETLSLLNGECPKGGLKVTGYITDAAVYCAITGGKYDISGNTNEVEDGNCTFFSGKVCNVWDLYNGKCEKGVVNPIIYNNAEYNFSLKLPRVWENKYQVKEESGDNGTKYISFYAGEPNLFKIAVVPYAQWEKESKHIGEYIGRDNSNVFAFVYSTDSLRSDKQWGDEYLAMESRVGDIKNTFTITKPYVFLEKNTENGKNYSIEIMYPYVGAVENGQVNVEINNFVQAIVSKFKEEMVKPDAWQGNNTLKVFYEPSEINDDFVSIRFEADEYNGGGNPASVSYGFNYDLKNSKIISLSDLFDSSKNYINAISERSIQYLLKVNKDNQFSDENWIKEGAGATEQNFNAFTFSKNAIVFNFNAEQVAPYASGRQEVVFPFSLLKDILRNDAVSAYNLKI